jgi:hypothetical protein
MDTDLISAGLLPSGTGAGIVKVLYPFVGGSATSHKYNFIDPQDTDLAKRIVWFGGMTHNADGITGNGSNAYGNMFINPDPDFNINDVGMSYLCSNSGIDGNTIFGVQDASDTTRFFHFPAFDGANTTQSNINSGSSQLIAAARQGFHSIQRTSGTNQNTYRNGVLNADTSTNSQNRAALNMFLLATNVNGTPTFIDASNIRFFAAHTALNATQALNLYNANVSFQTILGRNV